MFEYRMMKRVLPALILCTFASMVGSGIVAPLLPTYASRLGIAGIWLGIIFGAFSLSRAFLSPVFGRLSDKQGRRRYICIGVAGYALVSLGYTWADTPEVLVVVRLLQGAASAMILPIAQAYVGDISPEGEEGKWMGYFNAAFVAGFGFGPLLGGTVSDLFDIDVAFYVMGAMNLLALVAALVLLPAKEQRKVARPGQSSFRSMSRSPLTLGLWSMSFANALGMGASQAFFPILAHEIAGATPTQVGILLTVQIMVSSLGQAFGHLGDRWNRRWLAVLGHAISLIYLAGLPFTHDFYMMVILSVITGIGAAVSSWGTSALMVTEGRKFGMGSAMATFNMVGGLGMWLGPMLGGFFAQLISTSSTFFFAAATVAFSCLLFVWLAMRRRDDGAGLPTRLA
jgi:MFS family permease